MKKLMMTLFCTATLASCSVNTPEPEAAQEPLVYVGTYTSKGSEGIYVFRLNPASGELRPAHTISDRNNPSFLAVDAHRRRLYAVHELNNYLGADQGAVRAYSLDAETGKPAALNIQPSMGAHPCHIALDADGRYLFLANYSGGNIAMLPIKEDGSLLPPSDVVQHSGSSVNKSRQEGPHAHSVNLSPDGRFLLAADLGIDKIMIYRVDTQGGKLLPNNPAFVAAAPGAGPRHLTFDPTGRRVYVINELNSSITAYNYDAASGALTGIESVSTLPQGFGGANTCADIHVSPDGRFLFGSNRGHDSIVTFRIDDESGRLTLVGHTPSGGKTPRNFAVDPSGNFLLVANQNSDNIVVMRINRETGALTTLHEVRVSMPVCIKMVERL